MGCAAPHPFHWDDLRSKTPEEILRKPGVQRAQDGTAYEMEFLTARYRVDPVAATISEISPDPSRPLAEEFQILLIRYLISPYDGPLADIEVSEKDFPGGLTFFQGPHALHLKPIVRLYGSNSEAFETRAHELGALPVKHGDKGMRFTPFPLIPVTYVLWREDEEFPASVSVLFDKSITRWFELDMVFTLVLVLTERIIERQSVRADPV